MIQSPEELGALWQRFLQGKFSATELEQARAEYAELCAPNLDSEEDDLTASEFLEALRRLKIGKATGPDGIPAEVWKSSTVARDTLFFFLRQIWKHECVPVRLVLCVFVMLYKKGATND